MDDIIHVNASPTREQAEQKRLKYKDADNYGLFCAYRGDEVQSWVVLPNHVLELIHDNMAIDKKWVGLTREDKQAFVNQDLGGNRLDAMDWAEQRLREKNT
jgi:hypothetical protein